MLTNFSLDRYYLFAGWVLHNIDPTGKAMQPPLPPYEFALPMNLRIQSGQNQPPTTQATARSPPLLGLRWIDKIRHFPKSLGLKS